MEDAKYRVVAEYDVFVLVHTSSRTTPARRALPDAPVVVMQYYTRVCP
jgi:hypothetical protein